ncbi:MAG: cyclic nucleotide-binding domain-containing protein [Alphaproteobacteria bacterium]|nr:cyclic nucleotide-binding domain-containing protein [Alphaproteobacteria bacterium]
MKATDHHTGQFLSGLPFFTRLPEEDIDGFLKAGALHAYDKNDKLFLRGDAADRFFVIVNGWVKLFRETPEGEEAVVALFTRGDVFGEAAIFGGADYPFSAAAVEKSRLLEIPAAVLKDAARANPDIMQRVMASMSREMHQLQMETEHLSLMSAPQRVGCLILQLSSGMIGKGGTFTLPYDKSLAAQRLGMKPETFSRALAQLKPAGVSVSGSEISVESFDALIAFSCSHCSSLPGECKGSRTEGGCVPSAACIGHRAKINEE